MDCNTNERGSGIILPAPAMNSLASLNWNFAILLAICDLAILYGFLRVEKKARWISVTFLVMPMCYLIYRLATVRQYLVEMFVALGLALLLYLLWYIFYGHQLPKPTSDNITVWGEDE